MINLEHRLWEIKSSRLLEGLLRQTDRPKNNVQVLQLQLPWLLIELKELNGSKLSGKLILEIK